MISITCRVLDPFGARCLGTKMLHIIGTSLFRKNVVLGCGMFKAHDQ